MHGKCQAEIRMIHVQIFPLSILTESVSTGPQKHVSHYATPDRPAQGGVRHGHPGCGHQHARAHNCRLCAVPAAGRRP